MPAICTLHEPYRLAIRLPCLHRIHLAGQLRVGGGDAKWTALLPLAGTQAHAAQRDQVCRADDAAIGAQGDGLGHVERRAHPARGHEHHLVADALAFQEAVHLGDRIFQRHGDILLGYLGRGARAPIGAVQVHDVRARIVAAHRHHVHVGRGRNLDRDQGLRIDRLDPVHVFLVILHRVDAVEGKRRKEAGAFHGLAHLCHGPGHLAPQQVPAQARLGPLRVLELDDARPLDRLFSHAKQPRRYLGYHLLGVREQPVGVTPLAGRSERVPILRRPCPADHGRQADRAERHSRPIPGMRDADARAADPAGSAPATERVSPPRALTLASRTA